VRKWNGFTPFVGEAKFRRKRAPQCGQDLLNDPDLRRGKCCHRKKGSPSQKLIEKKRTSVFGEGENDAQKQKPKGDTAQIPRKEKEVAKKGKKGVFFWGGGGKPGRKKGKSAFQPARGSSNLCFAHKAASQRDGEQ